MDLSGTPGLELKPHAGSDRAFTYFTPDWSEDPETGVVEQKNELFAFRFANAESKCSLDTFHFGDVSRKRGSLLQALRLIAESERGRVTLFGLSERIVLVLQDPPMQRVSFGFRFIFLTRKSLLLFTRARRNYVSHHFY